MNKRRQLNNTYRLLICFFAGAISLTAEARDRTDADPALAMNFPAYIGPAVDYWADTNRAITMVSSMAVSPGGRLWVTWYAGPTPHEDENNYIVLATSDDDGATWIEVLVVDPDEFGEPLRTFDPELWVDPQGRLWWIWAQAVSHGINAQTWVMVADDPESPNPEWSEARIIAPGVMMCKPIVLSDGTWAFPISDWEGRRLQTPETATAGLWVSTDQGETFTLRGAALIPVEHRTYDEHMFIERKDGSLWLLVRNLSGYIGESVSTDGGHTWPEVTPSPISHPSARFFITRLQSGNLLLVKHGPIAMHPRRSHLMAFISRDEGVTWEGGLLLDERRSISYPDGQQAADGTIYITYDFDRRRARQVLFATFSEEDALAGKAVTDTVRLRQVVSRGTGGYENPPSVDTELLDNAEGEPLRMDQTGILTAEGFETMPLQGGVQLFTDRIHRGHFSYSMPAIFDGAHFIQLPMDGTQTVQASRAGTVFFLTPLPERNSESQSQALIDQGFQLVALPEFPLMGAGTVNSVVSLYQKDVEEGEAITVGKWAVPVFWP